jgi:SPX domain protein involved in polyphosphate accumulation
MHIVWLKRAYINPFSNASDIGKAMKHQAFASNHHWINNDMIDPITEYIKHIPVDAYSMGQKSLHQNSKYWGVQILNSA